MGTVRDRVPPRGVWVTTRTLFPWSISRFTLLKGSKEHPTCYFELIFISQSCLHLHFKCWILQGCTLAVLSGPWRLTFALRWLENLHFFIQIICWVPWISQGQSVSLDAVKSNMPYTFFFFLKYFFLHKHPLFSSIIVSIFIYHYSPLPQRKVTGGKHRQNLSVARKETILNWNNICSEANHLKPQPLNLLLMVNFPLIITLGLEFQARDDKRN